MPLDLASLIFSVSAGALSLFNPCGWAMLPGYVTYYLGSSSRSAALSAGLTTTAGFVGVFSAIGFAAFLLRSLIFPLIAYFLLLAGVIVLAMAWTMLSNRPLLPFLSRVGMPRLEGYPGLLAFGLAYGLASLGCTAPIFFSVLVFSIATGGFVNLVVTFLAYALGMGGLLVVFSLLVVYARDATVERVRGIIPHIHKVAGVGLIAVAAYLFYLFPIYYNLYLR